jgi:hypothetical protein
MNAYADLAGTGGMVGTKVFVVPRGAPVHSTKTGDWTPAKRKQLIDLERPGCAAERYGEWLVVTWPGAGGYWRRVVQHGAEYVDRWPG